MMLSRRACIFGGLSLALVGCERQKPKTPLAHLYGQEWVRGAYQSHARAYADVYRDAQGKSFGSYRHLAQRGVGSLSKLQAREVPFWIRVAADGSSFRVERDIPERLTFTADMSQEERERATAAWKNAREHVHADYEDVRQLDWALGELLGGVGSVRHASDAGNLEQFRLCRQLGEIDAGAALPFELPYQVSRQDYRTIALLLLERLEDDRGRLARVESSMVATGLVARATDAGSASLAENLRRVLLSVHVDAGAVHERPTDLPAGEERARLIARANQLRAEIVKSPEYRNWLALQREREDVIGQLLVVVDQVTGLGVSTIYRRVLRIWRGQGDYLELLRLASALVPGNGNLRVTLDEAVTRTEEVRGYVRQAGGARTVAGRIVQGQTAELADRALLNANTSQARSALAQQLVFYRDSKELEETTQALAETPLAQEPPPR